MIPLQHPRIIIFRKLGARSGHTSAVRHTCNKYHGLLHNHASTALTLAHRLHREFMVNWFSEVLFSVTAFQDMVFCVVSVTYILSPDISDLVSACIKTFLKILLHFTSWFKQHIITDQPQSLQLLFDLFWFLNIPLE